MPPSDFAAILVSQLKSLFPEARDDVVHNFVGMATRDTHTTPSETELQDLIEQFQLHLVMEADIGSKPLTRPHPGVDREEHQPMHQASQAAGQSEATGPQADTSKMQAEPYFASDTEFPVETDYIEQRTVSILEVLQSTFEKEEHFKQMCNKIYKGIKAYVQDPINPLNAMVPLFFDDLENNEDIFMQLTTLCTEFGILIDTREKGVFLVFKIPDYVSCRAEYYQMLEKLLGAFRSHKDESLVSRPSNQDKQKFNHMDANRGERVAAFFEAKNRRAAVASQFPMYWSANAAPQIAGEFHAQPVPGPSLDQMPHKYTDYPEDPSEVANEGPGLQGRLASPKMPFPKPATVANPPELARGGDVRAHIRENYDAIEKRLQQGNKVKVDRSAAQLAREQDSYLAQIQEYRNRVRNNNHPMIQKRNNPQSMTWGQLEQKADLERQEQLGRECLVHTNEFRKKHGLPPLKWEPLMFSIGRCDLTTALGHSRDMAFGKVPFGHAGFNKRADDMPFSKQSAGENVAYIGGVEVNRLASVGF